MYWMAAGVSHVMLGSNLTMAGGAFGISLSPSGIRDSPPIPWDAAALASWLWWMRSFSVSRTTARYSCWSTNPPALVINDSRVSAALRASSCVGEPGDDPTALDEMGVVRPAMLPLLLLRRSRGGGETACSKLKCDPASSLLAESRADDGAVDETWYFGVAGSAEWGWFMYSRSRVGKVWLRGRWKPAPCGGICPLRSPARNAPTFGSGEKLKEAVGLIVLPEKDVGVSVKALDREVVLWEFECLYAPSASKSRKPFRPSFSSSLLFADKGDGERWPDGDAGEMALCGCEEANAGEPTVLSRMLVSDARRLNLPGPMPCFNMNLSSQAELVGSRIGSPVDMDMNLRAVSLRASLVTAMPFFWDPRT